jgi:hypothetical protein
MLPTLSRPVGARLAEVALLFSSLTLSLTSCAHRAPAPAPDASPEAELRRICSAADAVQAARGFVTVSAKSKDASGRFPATVAAERAGGRLKMEVTNLTGGTEARISVEGERYEIEVPGKKKRVERGYGQWGGIPLRWANALFLGSLPCPPPGAAAEVSREVDGSLRATVRGGMMLGSDEESFLWTLGKVDGRSWPKGLTWERKGSFAKRVEFRFFEPEAGTGAPRRWEARGAEGEVKVRWNDRRVEPVPPRG